MQVSMLFKLSYIPQVIIHAVKWKSFHSQVKRVNCGRLFITSKSFQSLGAMTEKDLSP